MTQAESYFLQTHKGESRWWSWLIAFYFIALIYLAGQFLFTIPIMVITGILDPELMNAFFQVSASSTQKDNLAALAIIRNFTLLTTLLAIIGWIVNRQTQAQARRIAAWVTGIAAAISVTGLIILARSSQTEAVNATFLDMIAISPFNYAFLLLSFASAILGVFIMQKTIHKRTFVSLLTAAGHFRWKRALFAALLTFGLYALFAFIGQTTQLSELEWVFNPERFFAFAIVTLLLIPIQSGAEEIVFRGYLNQAFGHFIKHKWIVFIITSALFAAMHLSNPESVSGSEKGAAMHLLVMSSYFLFGLMLSVIIYLDAGIEAAIGIHAANNIFAAMVINYEGSVLPTPSIFLATPNVMIDTPLNLLCLSLILYILYKTRRTLPDDDNKQTTTLTS